MEKRRLGALAQRAASNHAVREDWRGISHAVVSNRRSDFLRVNFQRPMSAVVPRAISSACIFVKVWGGIALAIRQLPTAASRKSNSWATALVPPSA